MYLCQNIETLMIGRFIAGVIQNTYHNIIEKKLGIGIASMIIPIYLAEVSPTKIRGRIVTFNIIFITLGFLIKN
jgi:MFS transporter, SP family, solute carrier family 2 (myo-inositol transporter), member 13